MFIRGRPTTFLLLQERIAEDIFVNYTPFDSDWSKIVADVVALGADGKKVGVISTINATPISVSTKNCCCRYLC